jgi:hypothetical protein
MPSIGFTCFTRSREVFVKQITVNSSVKKMSANAWRNGDLPVHCSGRSANSGRFADRVIRVTDRLASYPWIRQSWMPGANQARCQGPKKLVHQPSASSYYQYFHTGNRANRIE